MRGFAISDDLFKRFTNACIIAVFLISSNTVFWALAVIVGNYGILDGFIDAYIEKLGFISFVFETALRAIPYMILWLFVLWGYNKNRVFAGIAWGGFLGISAYTFWSYWISLKPFYTNEHVSSTTGLIFLFIPFYAIKYGAIGSLTGGLLAYLSKFIQKRND